jgi:alpha-glucosidase
VKVDVALKNGLPRWSVAFKGASITVDGLLGVELANDNFAGAFELAGTEPAASDTTWRALWGNLSEVRDHYNQLTVKLKETGGKGRLLHVVLRAYNEGVGVRYEFPQQINLADVTVKNRLTEFRFTDNHTIYDNREYSYGKLRIDGFLRKSEGAVAVDVGRGNFVGLTDADRSDYSMNTWKAKKDVPNTICGGGPPASGKTPWKTSWEVMIIGETLGKLYENRCIVDNLNPPCALADTSWIRPGKAICQIRNAQMVTAELKKLLTFASAHKFEYMEIDHSWNGAETKWTKEEIESFDKNKKEFWEKHPEWRENVKGNPMVAAKGYVPFRPNSFNGGNLVDLDMPALTAYGKQLNPPVGVCVYVRSALFKEFGGEHAIEDVFAAYEKMGIAGVKPGFTPSVSQECERTVAYMVKKAAEHKLICVIHDGYYPYGLSRTYPNLMNIEGGAGEEAEHSVPMEMKSVHDVMLTFTRYLMGPFDYTPEIGKKLPFPKTHCHQAAMLGVWYGRHSVRGGMRQWSPGGENSGGEIEFIEKIPALFDEMKVTAEANRYVTVARRRGTTWYVASMSGAKAESYAYPVAFLAAGKTYKATIFRDTPGQRVATRSQQDVDAKTVIQLAMEANGGHMMIIEERAK